ncbi:hypothetical protein PS876_04039 [Pseudomonas fluorescens]|jgi:hypothetical protein|uniref:hypothetical protein n=1 Tax=Pseudomonas fluorescens TaxID=294 RepID=UPI00124280D2|nr:hypothetical protein [Pseudomonas fluorescens]VVP25133.1 hypothetical protein PS876_04039 [Pseudomonas fluorescens]
MSNDRNDPLVVAERLAAAIQPPTDRALSISTYFRPGKPLALKVFISPDFKYLEARIPDHMGGFEIFHEVAASVRAG